ncbi:23S rRNA (uracil(1939)-C(5))-methyltransferase RlmD [Aliiglaciecola sp.]|nr:23S rRNA (uracil(1939)-C(5))-methyltransferase RlmD [Aliiglaciecola sp.]
MANFYKPNTSSKALTKSIQQLRISGVDHFGSGISSDLNKVIFVSNALPGEFVEAEVVSGKGVASQANVLKIIEPSEQRTTPFCQHFEQCGGCQTQYCDAHAMLGYKQQAVDSMILHTTAIEAAKNKPIKKGSLSARRPKAAKSITIKDIVGQLPWEAAIHSEGQRYRYKTRLAVDARNPNDLRLGYRSRGSKNVFNLEACPILVDELAALIQPLQSVFQKLKQPNKIGHVSMVKGNDGVLVSIRIVKTLASNDIQLLTDFAQQQAISLFLETDSELINISDKSATLQYSPSPDIALDMHINDFVQVNNVVNQQMIKQAQDWLALEPNDSVLDLFCGIGNFSLPLAKHCKHVYGVEGVAKMVQRAQQNAHKNGLENCDFIQADLNEVKSLSKITQYQCNKVILDPSREGAKQTIDALPKLKPTHILYVSCNPATFSRDAAGLLQQNYRLVKIGLMDMFPQTSHTELMALFMRSDYLTDTNGD